MTDTNTCGGCTTRWSGHRRAHCAAEKCHRTFATAALFDRHRRAGACVDPATIDGLRLVDGIWMGPAMTADQLARMGWPV